MVLYLGWVKDTILKIEWLVVADFVPVAPVHVGQGVPDDVLGEQEPGLQLAHGLVVRLGFWHLAHVHVPGDDQGVGHPGQAPRHHQGSVGDQEEQLVASQVRLALTSDKSTSFFDKFLFTYNMFENLENISFSRCGLVKEGDLSQMRL